MQWRAAAVLLVTVFAVTGLSLWLTELQKGFFDALKAYCNDPASRADPDRPRLHRATYALHDVRSEPPLTAEERRNIGTPHGPTMVGRLTGYPFNALPADWFRRA